MDQTVASCRDLLKLKGGEYSGGEDVLANFKRAGIDNGITALQANLVYLGKHMDSIKTYVRNDAKGVEQVLSEPIEGRFHDAINYLILLLALVREGQGARLASGTSGYSGPLDLTSHPGRSI